jgi:hypothetical protein
MIVNILQCSCHQQWCMTNQFGQQTPHQIQTTLQKQGGICGPWIPDDGKIVTHTVSKAGKMSQKIWTSKVLIWN